VSEGATLIPLTGAYIKRDFPGVDSGEVFMRLANPANVAAYTEALVRDHASFQEAPALDIPIDFDDLAQFLVVSGTGSVRLYRVGKAPEIRNFVFRKADNPLLAHDAIGVIAGDKITVDVLFESEIGDFDLIPSFIIVGEGLQELGGAALVSGGKPKLEFEMDWYVLQQKSLRVYGGPDARNYTLEVNFDYVKGSGGGFSITGFDFYAADNPSFLAFNSSAQIVGTTIKIEVMLLHDVDLAYMTLSPVVTVNGYLSLGGQGFDPVGGTITFSNVTVGVPVLRDLVVYPLTGTGQKDYTLEVTFRQ